MNGLLNGQSNNVAERKRAGSSLCQLQHTQLEFMADTAYHSVHLLSGCRPQAPTAVMECMSMRLEACRVGLMAPLQGDAAPVTGIWGHQQQPCCSCPCLHITLLFHFAVLQRGSLLLAQELLV